MLLRTITLLACLYISLSCAYAARQEIFKWSVVSRIAGDGTTGTPTSGNNALTEALTNPFVTADGGNNSVLLTSSDGLYKIASDDNNSADTITLIPTGLPNVVNL